MEFFVGRVMKFKSIRELKIVQWRAQPWSGGTFECEIRYDDGTQETKSLSGVQLHAMKSWECINPIIPDQE